ncbi:hypothetical protein [Microbacterium sp. 77mftsu3.1]|uniref:hypothetical protein n=1 Tax=Microbacterium sp. 77mftsu3.1 TaxID=1761802 RepID=UPI00037B0D24|nr:hypothetical protein [Microbacterium sp. 77mftsu3.1]SDH40959.1 hypothetical protein SAMN04488590_3268 [Microbacterium sp. 77mftsu3.1]
MTTSLDPAVSAHTRRAAARRSVADKLRTGAIGASVGAILPGTFAFAWAFTGPLGPDGMYDPLRQAASVFTAGLLVAAFGLAITAAIYQRLSERATASPATQASTDGELDLTGARRWVDRFVRETGVELDDEETEAFAQSVAPLLAQRHAS